MAKKKHGFIQGLAAGIAVTLAGTAAAGILYTQFGSPLQNTGIAEAAQTSSDEVVTAELIQKLQALEQLVGSEFLMETGDAQSFRDSIYKGYMDALGDPYSCYYTADELAQMEESIHGRLQRHRRCCVAGSVNETDPDCAGV